MLPRLETVRIGSNWVVRSPDVPELFVAHEDRVTAERHVPEALAMIERMRERLAARDDLKRRMDDAAA